MRAFRGCEQRERGQSMVEYALTLPLLILLVMGVFDFGRAIWYYNTLSEAAREGTRFAMVHGSYSTNPIGPGTASFTSPDRDSRVEEVAYRFGFGMDTDQMGISAVWPDGDNKVGHRVEVEARYTYTPLTSMILGGVPIPLRSRSAAIIVY